MAPPSQGNDRRPHRTRFAQVPSRAADASSHEWLWGWHTVVAALQNPARAPIKRLLATAERARQLRQILGEPPALEVVAAGALSDLTPRGAAHQGVALRAQALVPTSLSDLAEPAGGLLVMLDQVTDPQNVGAIFRCAAAFGARGVILQERHAPALTGALAKAAAGAVDKIAHARETNLSRTLERLEALGWRAIGLDAAAQQTLVQVLDDSPTVLVLGSEGDGLRRLVREHCEAFARIPMQGGFESLNVAATAAVALYEATRSRG